jgi:hypothetical protein
MTALLMQARLRPENSSTAFHGAMPNLNAWRSTGRPQFRLSPLQNTI